MSQLLDTLKFYKKNQYFFAVDWEILILNCLTKKKEFI